jgi:hypothetical protein
MSGKMESMEGEGERIPEHQVKVAGSGIESFPWI